jgi:hypothetical protein
MPHRSRRRGGIQPPPPLLPCRLPHYRRCRRARGDAGGLRRRQ